MNIDLVMCAVLKWKRDKVECGKGVEKVEDLGGY